MNLLDKLIYEIYLVEPPDEVNTEDALYMIWVIVSFTFPTDWLSCGWVWVGGWRIV